MAWHWQTGPSLPPWLTSGPCLSLVVLAVGVCRQKAIEFCKPGRAYKDIGGIIEEYITKYGYTTVR